MLSLILAAASPFTLYHGLDQHSIPEQLAFYELYPDSSEGEEARKRAWELMGGKGDVELLHSTPNLQHLVDLLAKQGLASDATLTDEQLALVNELARPLKNRKLSGHNLWSEEEILALDSKDIDLARALLVSLFDDEQQIKTYEAMIDLMCLHILSRTSFTAPARHKIATINWYLFDELRLRFPPHSLYSEDIDFYTFLPSVLDSRRGVCLGVSTLYLCIAQRLGLNLEIITPPGHIYVRYNGGEINIETTARGIHVPSSHYLSVHTKSLQQRTLKEVVGMTFFNQASALWQAGKVRQAISAYEKALPYTPDDPLTKELLAYCLILDGKSKRGYKLLSEIKDHIPDHQIGPNTLAHDVLAGRVPKEGLAALFQRVDENRESILDKQNALKKVLKKAPLFRAGHFALATTYLQLGRQKEAIPHLKKHYTLDPDDPTTAYYLAALHFERSHYPAAWEYLQSADEIATHKPQALKDLRRALRAASPR